MGLATKKELGNFVCNHCGLRRVQYHPQCAQCLRWNTFHFSAPSQGTFGLLSGSVGGAAQPARRLDEAGLSPGRVRTGVPFFDELTGGGMVAGASALVYGPKGAGKSTLAAQVSFWTAVRSGRPALVVSGEEWIVQVRDRVERLGLTPGWIWFNSPVDLPTVEADLKRLRPSILVVDSVQKLDDPRDGRPGSHRTKRAFLNLLTMLREYRTSALLLSQVNRKGEPMGGNMYEHEPDAVFCISYADPADKKNHGRVLAADKNRFGEVKELALKMTGQGLVEA